MPWISAADRADLRSSWRHRLRALRSHAHARRCVRSSRALVAHSFPARSRPQRLRNCRLVPEGSHHGLSRHRRLREAPTLSALTSPTASRYARPYHMYAFRINRQPRRPSPSDCPIVRRLNAVPENRLQGRRARGDVGGAAGGVEVQEHSPATCRGPGDALNPSRREQHRACKLALHGGRLHRPHRFSSISSAGEVPPALASARTEGALPGARYRAAMALRRLRRIAQRCLADP